VAESPATGPGRVQSLWDRVRRWHSPAEPPWLPEMTDQEARWLDRLLAGLLLLLFVGGAVCRVPGTWGWVIAFVVLMFPVVLVAIGVFTLVVTRRHHLSFWSTYLDGLFPRRRRRASRGSAVTPPE